MAKHQLHASGRKTGLLLGPVRLEPDRVHLALHLVALLRPQLPRDHLLPLGRAQDHRSHSDATGLDGLEFLGHY